MATPVVLLEALEDLADGEFKRFRWFLQQAEVLEGFPAVPKSLLENADRLDTVDQLTETYNKNALEVMIKVLRRINKNDLVPRLSALGSIRKLMVAYNDSMRLMLGIPRRQGRRQKS
ncbi:pyrin domain-containing protein 1-like [Thalassophryne amazonica]|uniref:pyrin domain-containing protein 1-like n=1 Tax=Thalassophryne amazonica TaxID=390379 RepID=UPI00147132BC|nr:pyrin domain-containing protein 1-like [Thalassophryne amazonica]